MSVTNDEETKSIAVNNCQTEREETNKEQRGNSGHKGQWQCKTGNAERTRNSEHSRQRQRLRLRIVIQTACENRFSAQKLQYTSLASAVCVRYQRRVARIAHAVRGHCQFRKRCEPQPRR